MATTATNINPLQLKRGTIDRVLDYIPADGEPLWSYDTHQLFIGDGSTPGGIPLIGSTSTSSVFNQDLNTFNSVAFESVDIYNYLTLNEGTVKIGPGTTTSTYQTEIKIPGIQENLNQRTEETLWFEAAQYGDQWWPPQMLTIQGLANTDTPTITYDSTSSTTLGYGSSYNVHINENMLIMGVPYEDTTADNVSLPATNQLIFVGNRRTGQRYRRNAIKENDELGAIIFKGQDQDDSDTSGRFSAIMGSVATEDFSPSAKGSGLFFNTAARGSGSVTGRLYLDELYNVHNSDSHVFKTANNTATNAYLSLNDGTAFRTNFFVVKDENNVQRFKVDGAYGVRINNAYTLPTSDGTNGYVLTTDGSGHVSWAAGSGGGGGVTEIIAGDGISVNTSTGAVTITASGGVSTSTFDTIKVRGQIELGAYDPGVGFLTRMVMVYNTTTQGFTISATPGFSGAGGGYDSINIGNYSGGGNRSVALGHQSLMGLDIGDSIGIGFRAGKGLNDDSQTNNTIIGNIITNNVSGQYDITMSDTLVIAAGPDTNDNQRVRIGTDRIILGKNAFTATVASNSIILNASDTTLSSDNSGLYIDPIRNSTSTQVLYYDTDTKEVTYGPAPESGGSTSTVTGVYALNELPTGTPGSIITISDSGSDTNSPAGNWAPAYWDSDDSLWYYVANSNSVNATNTYRIDYLVVAGGGGGGEWNAGGGGAGGYLAANRSIVVGTSYSIVVGSGGAGGTGGNGGTAEGNTGSIGNDSFFDTIQTYGGGGGGAFYHSSPTNGGSGGGAGWVTEVGGTGVLGQGHNGGTSAQSSPPYMGSGGGGAGSAGQNSDGTAGIGGDGLQWLDGNYYAGGGGSGGNTAFSAGGTGGGGHGGASGSYPTAGQDGTANTGCGGGGGGTTVYGSGGAGGSGIVIIRYAGSTRGSGGTITSSDGYTYHTFTASDTYTA